VAGTDDCVVSTAWGEPIHPDTVSLLMITYINTATTSSESPCLMPRCTTFATYLPQLLPRVCRRAPS
jgi:hypothetical protein